MILCAPLLRRGDCICCTGILKTWFCDDLKAVNDNFGHNIGVGEFAITAAGLNPEKAGMQIKNLVNKIHQKLAEGWYNDGHHFAPTASIGIAFYPKDANNFDDLVKMADSALYESKKSGRNQVRFYRKEEGRTH